MNAKEFTAKMKEAYAKAWEGISELALLPVMASIEENRKFPTFSRIRRTKRLLQQLKSNLDVLSEDRESKKP